MLWQWTTHRFPSGALLDVGNHDDILGRRRLRRGEHLVDQRQLTLLDRLLLGLGAKETVFEGLDAQFEQTFLVAPPLTELPQKSHRFLEGRGGWIWGNYHAKRRSNNAARRPVFIDLYAVS